MPEAEQHYFNRAGWLRAAVLGANDGIISTASLIMGGGRGLAAGNSDRSGRGLGGGRDVDGGGRICLRQLAGQFRDRRS